MFRFTSRWQDEEALIPKDVWRNDLDAFTASCEDLNEGGHGIWYGSSVEEVYTDELHDAYKQINSTLMEGRAHGRTEERAGDTDDEGTGDGDQRDRPAAE